ncbi:hypothetical protein INR49_026223 [Caranx melampygus]|nr:hypothetical protein INR49_026223 [Caranx melampygus]
MCTLALTKAFQFFLIPDTEEFGVFMGNCTLPCSFKSSTPDAVIHWYQLKPQYHRVHSYYSQEDQLTNQDQRFRGRTSLFKDQISRGNASLQLTGLEVLDQGRYKCVTSINSAERTSYIHLKVGAPVGKVHIQQEENNITCSSQGIYPEPQLTWSTSPSSNQTFKNTTEVQRTQQLLYNISSSLISSVSGLTYTCTVSTDRNRRRATLFKPTSVIWSSYEITIPCTALNISRTDFSLTWSFNHVEIILTQTRGDVVYTVSESDAEETLITNTFVGTQKDKVDLIRDIIITVAVGIVVIAVGALVLWCKKRRGQQINTGQHCVNHCLQEMHVMADVNESKRLQSGEVRTYSSLLRSNEQEVEAVEAAEGAVTPPASS